MLFIFKSKAAADVIMFGDVAARLLHIMGKPADAKGIITVEQLPAAIARLKQAAAGDEPAHEATEPEDAAAGDHPPAVRLAARALPLVELLERSLKAKVPVVWGV
jgi:hypothetical protein